MASCKSFSFIVTPWYHGSSGLNAVSEAFVLHKSAFEGNPENVEFLSSSSHQNSQILNLKSLAIQFPLRFAFCCFTWMLDILRGKLICANLNMSLYDQEFVTSQK